MCRYSKSAALSFPSSVYLLLPLFCSLSPPSYLLSFIFPHPSFHPPPSIPFPQRLDVLTSIYSMSPPEGSVWDSHSGAADVLTCVYMPDGLTVQVPVRRDQTAADLLSAACKVGLEASCGEMMTPQQLLHIPDGCCKNQTKAVMSFGLSCLVEFYTIVPFIHNGESVCFPVCLSICELKG